MKTNLPSTDPSPLYGRVFEEWLRVRIFEVACKVLGLNEDDRDLYVGTEYYVLRTIDDVGRALLKKALADIDGGMGEHSAFAPLLDFKDMVNKGSYFPKIASEKPAPKTTPAPKPAEQPKPQIKVVKTSETLGDQIGVEGVDALNASVFPVPAPAASPRSCSCKGKCKKCKAAISTAEVAPASYETAAERPEAAQA